MPYDRAVLHLLPGQFGFQGCESWPQAGVRQAEVQPEAERVGEEGKTAEEAETESRDCQMAHPQPRRPDEEEGQQGAQRDIRIVEGAGPPFVELRRRAAMALQLGDLGFEGGH